MLNYIIENTDNKNQITEIAVAVREELEAHYLQKERIKWATQTAEQNTIVILDVLNTILHKEKMKTCISVEFAASPVITQSQESIKEKIHYFKQKSDERKSKKTRGQ